MRKQNPDTSEGIRILFAPYADKNIELSLMLILYSLFFSCKCNTRDSPFIYWIIDGSFFIVVQIKIGG